MAFTGFLRCFPDIYNYDFCHNLPQHARNVATWELKIKSISIKKSKVIGLWLLLQNSPPICKIAPLAERYPPFRRFPAAAMAAIAAVWHTRRPPYLLKIQFLSLEYLGCTKLVIEALQPRNWNTLTCERGPYVVLVLAVRYASRARRRAWYSRRRRPMGVSPFRRRSWRPIGGSVSLHVSRCPLTILCERRHCEKNIEVLINSTV